jgi:hypothetical protein
MLVGAVGIEISVISKKPRKQQRCSRSYRDNHYNGYSASSMSFLTNLVALSPQLLIIHRRLAPY